MALMLMKDKLIQYIKENIYSEDCKRNLCSVINKTVESMKEAYDAGRPAEAVVKFYRARVLSNLCRPYFCNSDSIISYVLKEFDSMTKNMLGSLEQSQQNA